ncbi:endo-1,4-beta-xylanase [Fulvimarina pelagi HTCC2506]|uniref:Beta-xylanase n=2 Tax=Fulvimarina pelagi TaxID=217511 RepID=Q0G548_9HYPH|nr:endo-1,4-beta-xylanase [Fulvimarina pelagi HTCC2506]
MAIGKFRPANSTRQPLTRRSAIKAGLGMAITAATFGGATGAVARDGRVALGGAIQSDYFDSDPRYGKAFLDHYDLVMPMNELKFSMIHPERDRWNFEPADRLVDFATTNGKLTRGHTHVWWGAMPDWVEEISSRREAESVLIEHIERVTDRYRGRLTGWDVVNEVIAYDPREDGPLRDTYWLRMLGPLHIPLAYQTVARTDPSARLVINDFDLEWKGELYTERRKVMLQLVRQLQDGGIDIRGVGIQGHLYVGREIDKEGLEAFHRELDRLGVALLVTELDVIDLESSTDPAIMDEAAYSIVKDFLDGIFAWKRPEMVVVWGITDRYTWIPDVMPRDDGSPHRPLPLTRDYAEKDWMVMLKRRMAP